MGAGFGVIQLFYPRQIPTGALKPHSGLELVLRWEPSIYQPIS